MIRKLLCLFVVAVVLTGCTAFNSNEAPEVIGSGEVCEIE